MNDSELMVTIPLNRYTELVENETRLEVLTRVTVKERYSVNKEDIATILGFELPVEPEKQGGEF